MKKIIFISGAILCFSTFARVTKKESVEQLPSLTLSIDNTQKVDQAVKKSMNLKLDKPLDVPVKVEMVCKKKRIKRKMQYHCQAFQIKKL